LRGSPHIAVKNIHTTSLLVLIAALCLCATIVALPPSAASAQNPAARVLSYDGDWWLAISKFERIGYIEGDEDCDSFARGLAPLDPIALQPYPAQLTAYYSADPARRATTAYQALRRFSAQAPRPRTGPVNSPEDFHGDFDGLFWRDTRREERLGFVEGYLACFVHTAPRHRAVYSKSPADYLALLDTWFHLSDREEDVDPKIENAKIADALYRLRDRRSWPRL
jgi:hypothetical protein